VDDPHGVEPRTTQKRHSSLLRCVENPIGDCGPPTSVLYQRYPPNVPELEYRHKAEPKPSGWRLLGLRRIVRGSTTLLWARKSDGGTTRVEDGVRRIRPSPEHPDRKDIAFYTKYENRNCWHCSEDHVKFWAMVMATCGKYDAKCNCKSTIHRKAQHT